MKSISRALPEVAEINPRRFSKDVTDNSLVSFVPMKSVEEETGRLVAEQTKRWSEVRKGYTPFQDGDVLFAKITPCMENGKYALASSLHDGRAAGSTEFHVFRPKPELDPKYLLFFLFSPEVRREAKRSMRGAAGQLRVPPSFFEELQIPLPSPDEQQRIVAEIEKQFTRLDAGVSSLKRVHTALRRYRASVLKAACEGRLVPTEAELAGKENRSYETGEELLQHILKERRVKWNGKGKYKEPTAPKPTSHPDLPEGWVWTGFEQLADGTKHAIKAGPFGSSLKKSVYTATGFKIYGQEQVIRGDPYFGDYFISRELFEQLQSCEAKPGDILMSLVGTAGRVLILPSDCTPGIINPRLLKLSLNRSGVNPMFIKILLESATARAFFKLAGHGGTMEILNLGILKALPVPLPPIAEQTRIVAEAERRISVVEELTDVVSANQRRAVGLRKSVLRQAFSGRLTRD